jgi:hypothetical protein
MSVGLQEWLANGWLIEHRTSGQEIGDLLAVADRDLRDAQTPGLSADWRLNIAYNAALQAAIAALAAAGCRAGREAQHFRVLHSLEYTIGADPVLIAQLDQFRKKRNISGYERPGAVSDQEASEMLSLAQRLRCDVEEWIRTNRPELL